MKKRTLTYFTKLNRDESAFVESQIKARKMTRAEYLRALIRGHRQEVERGSTAPAKHS